MNEQVCIHPEHGGLIKVISEDNESETSTPSKDVLPNNDGKVVEYLLRYETMVRQQEAENMASMQYIQHILEELQGNLSNNNDSNNKIDSPPRLLMNCEEDWEREISFHDLQRAVDNLNNKSSAAHSSPCGAGYIITDRQLMMVLDILSQQMSESSRQSITYAEFLQCYKYVVVGMQTMQHLSHKEKRQRTKDRTLSVVSLFQPSTTTTSKEDPRSASSTSTNSRDFEHAPRRVQIMRTLGEQDNNNKTSTGKRTNLFRTMFLGICILLAIAGCATLQFDDMMQLHRTMASNLFNQWLPSFLPAAVPSSSNHLDESAPVFEPRVVSTPSALDTRKANQHDDKERHLYQETNNHDEPEEQPIMTPFMMMDYATTTKSPQVVLQSRAIVIRDDIAMPDTPFSTTKSFETTTSSNLHYHQSTASRDNKDYTGDVDDTSNITTATIIGGATGMIVIPTAWKIAQTLKPLAAQLPGSVLPMGVAALATITLVQTLVKGIQVAVHFIRKQQQRPRKKSRNVYTV